MANFNQVVTQTSYNWCPFLPDLFSLRSFHGTLLETNTTISPRAELSSIYHEDIAQKSLVVVCLRDIFPPSSFEWRSHSLNAIKYKRSFKPNDRENWTGKILPLFHKKNIRETIWAQTISGWNCLADSPFCGIFETPSIYMTRTPRLWLSFRVNYYQLQRITLMAKAKMDSEANHPVFLPRLVPHVFNNQPKSQSRPKNKAPRRSVPPRPTTPGPFTRIFHGEVVCTPTRHTLPPMSRTKEHHTTTSSTTQTTRSINRGATIRIWRAIFDGDPNIAATGSIFAKFQSVNPETAASVLALLASGEKEDQKIMTHLISKLYETDPLAANSLVLTLFSGKGYHTAVSDASTSVPSATDSIWLCHMGPILFTAYLYIFHYLEFDFELKYARLYAVIFMWCTHFMYTSPLSTCIYRTRPLLSWVCSGQR